MLLAFHQRVVLIQKDFGQDDNLNTNEILINLKNNLLSTSESPTTSKMSLLHSFITVST
jgi:hypothetical protein